MPTLEHQQQPERRRSSWLPIPCCSNWPGMSWARAPSAQRRRRDLEPLHPHERQLIAALNHTIPEADVPA